MTVPLAIQQSVSGTVTDKNGKGLSGATVTVKELYFDANR
jgi:hypothetical protein